MHCIISNVRTRTPLLLFARTSYFKLKRPILRKLRLHNFKFNFVARNFVISAKTFPLVPCLTSTPATDFNVKTTIRAKCYESSKIGFKPRSVRDAPQKKKRENVGILKKQGGGSTRIPLPCFTVFNMGEPPKKVLKCKKKT